MNSRNQQQVFKTVVTPGPTHAKGSTADNKSVNRQAFESMGQPRGFAGNHTFNGRMLQRKCGCGNQSGKCDCKKPDDRTMQGRLQTKLAVGEASDRYEQEADRVAAQVLAAPVNASVRSIPPRIQRVAAQSMSAVGTAPRSVDHALSSPGRPLGPSLQSTMERRFGFDFSSVRVHTGAAAETSARDVNAHAYTVGNSIVFGPGRFAPSSHEGQKLIAHELTHVVQQSSSRGRAMSDQIQRKVVDDVEHLPCRDDAGSKAKQLAGEEAKAASLADNAAAALRARPLAEKTRKLVWTRFRRDYNNPIDRCRFIPELADRFARIASEIRSTECTYGCANGGQPSELCNGHFAFTYPRILNDPKIDLCTRFWDNPSEQAVTLLHEWAHHVYRFRGLKDEPGGSIDTGECYGNFVAELIDQPVPDFGDISKCDPNPNEPPALDLAKAGLPCPGNTFLNFSALAGVAGVPGPNRYLGFGVDLLFPMTRMHDWELALGARFLRFAPGESRAARMVLVRADLAFRKQPWRFGRQLGAHVEGGLIDAPKEVGGSETRGFVGAGLTAGVNIRISEDKALRILGEVGVGRAFATDDEKGLWVTKAGLSIGFTFEGL